MRIVFMGTPDFAVASLEALITKGYNVVAVVTATDKYGGRGGKQLLESPVKRFSLSKNIPVLQPERLKAPDFVSQLREFNADIFIVVAFRMLPEIIWAMPRLGTYNIHASLLPRYRGAAPINWAIINGERKTGVTSFKLTHEIDTGQIALQKDIEIDPDDTAGSLHDKLMILGAQLLIETVNKLENGDLTLTAQNEAEVCHAPKIFHETCKIDFNQNISVVHNFIRGLSPYPAAYTYIDGRELKIYKSRAVITDHQNPPGLIATDNKTYFHIYCRSGFLDILEIKQEGKKLMDVRSWLNGYKISNQSIL